MRKEAEDLEAYLSERILREADVVCATLVGCDDRRLRGVTFDVAVVDEAAQALPPRDFDSNCVVRTGSVLCGDPCQLAADGEKSEAAKLLKKTMLERLMDKPMETRPSCLQVQHRMHAAIMSAGNERFYGRQIEGATKTWRHES